MSLQKQAGTSAESAVVKYLHDHGHPEARRLVLAGSADQGDVWVTHGVIAEVKHRRTTTSNAGVGQPGKAELAKWMAEAETERINARADIAVLIVKRSGTTNVGDWWAYLPLWAVGDLLDVDRSEPMEPVHPIGMSVDTFLSLV